MRRGLQKIRRPGSLKEAEAELVQACGGQSASAEFARVGKSQLARYTDDSGDNETVHMPADIVEVLERACGEPIVTRFLAAASGHVLIDCDPIALAKPYPVLLSAIGRDSGELFAECAKALADGTLRADERGRVKRELNQLLHAAACFRAELDRSET